jgi:hypothetical protein
MNFPTPLYIAGQLALVLGLTVFNPSVSPAAERQGETKAHVPTKAPGLSVKPLSAALVPSDLARLLVGPGVPVTNITYAGDSRSAGTFRGGAGIIGFERGIILSTGQAVDVVGPNTLDRTSTNLKQAAAVRFHTQ